ncbi:hypothetical protein LX36DRAFT_704184 [Colletotrichum falcatum]|nr:hypothetical protein LX36DRAFT_704184 [Colletotrichum falcatum]
MVRQLWIQWANNLLRGDDLAASWRRESWLLQTDSRGYLATIMYLLCGVGVISSRPTRTEIQSIRMYARTYIDAKQATGIQVGGRHLWGTEEMSDALRNKSRRLPTLTAAHHCIALCLMEKGCKMDRSLIPNEADQHQAAGRLRRQGKGSDECLGLVPKTDETGAKMQTHRRRTSTRDWARTRSIPGKAMRRADTSAEGYRQVLIPGPRAPATYSPTYLPPYHATTRHVIYPPFQPKLHFPSFICSSTSPPRVRYSYTGFARSPPQYPKQGDTCLGRYLSKLHTVAETRGKRNRQCMSEPAVLQQAEMEAAWIARQSHQSNKAVMKLSIQPPRCHPMHCVRALRQIGDMDGLLRTLPSCNAKMPGNVVTVRLPSPCSCSFRTALPAKAPSLDVLVLDEKGCCPQWDGSRLATLCTEVCLPYSQMKKSINYRPRMTSMECAQVMPVGHS